MLRLAADPPLRRDFGAAARDRALTRFSEEAAIAGVEAVYRTLLEGRTDA